MHHGTVTRRLGPSAHVSGTAATRRAVLRGAGMAMTGLMRHGV